MDARCKSESNGMALGNIKPDRTKGSTRKLREKLKVRLKKGQR